MLLSCFTSLRYLILSFFIITTAFYNIFYIKNITLSKCCLQNINININKIDTSLCLTNNVFIFGQKETISVSSTPSSSITSFNLCYFSLISWEPFCPVFFTKKIILVLESNFFHFQYFFLSINQKLMI